MENQIYHIVYLIRNKVNNKIYIGIHSTENINDHYLGSGRYLLKAIKKYGYQNFERIILHFTLTREHASDLERMIVNEQFVSDPQTYNLRVGGDNSYVQAESTKNKIGDANRGCKNGMYGVVPPPLTEAQRLHLSVALKSSTKFQESRKSPEYRKKISDIQSNEVTVISLKTNKIVMTAKNARDLANILNCTHGNIKNAIRHKRPIGSKIKKLSEKCMVMYTKDLTF